ncbi:MAG: alpha/beta fold hydrolase [Elusimicrobia bacterium]|nr:alpha/beta fold hydrolase [Elusimicrobiota bacterium]MBD3412133.1 alpha/beta fold hydrolase [Elusimicrobiota bacterium]
MQIIIIQGNRMKIVLWIVVGVIIFIVYVKILERKSLYFPIKEIQATPETIGLTYADVTITTEDTKKLNAWFVRADSAEYTILFAHGNAGNISHRLDKVFFFVSLGCDVLVFDYRGYGQSQGSPSEQGIYRDTSAAYRYLTETRSIPPERIILYGESLGGAAVIDCASHNPAAGLITEDTFSSALDMAKIYYPFVPTFLISLRYDSADKISRIAIPKLFFHSTDDEIVPIALGKKLYETAHEPKTFVELNGSHNMAFFDSKDTVENALKKFIKTLKKGSTP